jgi:hypothetical protein
LPVVVEGVAVKVVMQVVVAVRGVIAPTMHLPAQLQRPNFQAAVRHFSQLLLRPLVRLTQLQWAQGVQEAQVVVVMVKMGEMGMPQYSTVLQR